MFESKKSDEKSSEFSKQKEDAHQKINYIPRTINVSGHGNNCGLYAFSLAVALVIRKSDRIYPNIPDYVSDITEEFVSGKDRDKLIKIGIKLRKEISKAIELNEQWKQSRIIHFINLCNTSKYEWHLNSDMESFYESSEEEIIDIQNKVKIKLSNDANYVSPLQNVEINLDDVNTLLQQLTPFLNNKIEQHSIFQIIQNWVNNGNLNKIIYFSLLFGKIKNHEEFSKTSEKNRQDLMTIIVEKWLQQQVNLLLSNTNETEHAHLLFLLGSCRAAIEGAEPLDFARHFYINYILNSKWDGIYQNYVNYLREKPVMLSADELGCLASAWEVQLTIKFRDNRIANLGTTKEDGLVINLSNPSQLHWQVESIIEVNEIEQQSELSINNTTQIKSRFITDKEEVFQLLPSSQPVKKLINEEISEIAHIEHQTTLLQDTLRTTYEESEVHIQIEEQEGYTVNVLKDPAMLKESLRKWYRVDEAEHKNFVEQTANGEILLDKDLKWVAEVFDPNIKNKILDGVMNTIGFPLKYVVSQIKIAKKSTEVGNLKEVLPLWALQIFSYALENGQFLIIRNVFKNKLEILIKNLREIGVKDESLKITSVIGLCYCVNEEVQLTKQEEKILTDTLLLPFDVHGRYVYEAFQTKRETDILELKIRAAKALLFAIENNQKMREDTFVILKQFINSIYRTESEEGNEIPDKANAFIPISSKFHNEDDLYKLNKFFMSVKHKVKKYVVNDYQYRSYKGKTINEHGLTIIFKEIVTNNDVENIMALFYLVVCANQQLPLYDLVYIKPKVKQIVDNIKVSGKKVLRKIRSHNKDKKPIDKIEEITEVYNLQKVIKSLLAIIEKKENEYQEIGFNAACALSVIPENQINDKELEKAADLLLKRLTQVHDIDHVNIQNYTIVSLSRIKNRLSPEKKNKFDSYFNSLRCHITDAIAIFIEKQMQRFKKEKGYQPPITDNDIFILTKLMDNENLQLASAAAGALSYIAKYEQYKFNLSMHDIGSKLQTKDNPEQVYRATQIIMGYVRNKNGVEETLYQKLLTILVDSAYEERSKNNVICIFSLMMKNHYQDEKILIPAKIDPNIISLCFHRVKTNVTQDICFSTIYQYALCYRKYHEKTDLYTEDSLVDNFEILSKLIEDLNYDQKIKEKFLLIIDTCIEAEILITPSLINSLRFLLKEEIFSNRKKTLDILNRILQANPEAYFADDLQLQVIDLFNEDEQLAINACALCIKYYKRYKEPLSDSVLHHINSFLGDIKRNYLASNLILSFIEEMDYRKIGYKINREGLTSLIALMNKNEDIENSITAANLFHKAMATNKSLIVYDVFENLQNCFINAVEVNSVSLTNIIIQIIGNIYFEKEYKSIKLLTHLSREKIAVLLNRSDLLAKQRITLYKLLKDEGYYLSRVTMTILIHDINQSNLALSQTTLSVIQSMFSSQSDIHWINNNGYSDDEFKQLFTCLITNVNRRILRFHVLNILKAVARSKYVEKLPKEVSELCYRMLLEYTDKKYVDLAYSILSLLSKSMIKLPNDIDVVYRMEEKSRLILNQGAKLEQIQFIIEHLKKKIPYSALMVVIEFINTESYTITKLFFRDNTVDKIDILKNIVDVGHHIFPFVSDFLMTKLDIEQYDKEIIHILHICSKNGEALSDVVLLKLQQHLLLRPYAETINLLRQYVIKGFILTEDVEKKLLTILVEPSYANTLLWRSAALLIPFFIKLHNMTFLLNESFESELFELLKNAENEDKRENILNILLPLSNQKIFSEANQNYLDLLVQIRNYNSSDKQIKIKTLKFLFIAKIPKKHKQDVNKIFCSALSDKDFEIVKNAVQCYFIDDQEIITSNITEKLVELIPAGFSESIYIRIFEKITVNPNLLMTINIESIICLSKKLKLLLSDNKNLKDEIRLTMMLLLKIIIGVQEDKIKSSDDEKLINDYKSNLLLRQIYDQTLDSLNSERMVDLANLGWSFIGYHEQLLQLLNDKNKADDVLKACIILLKNQVEFSQTHLKNLLCIVDKSYINRVRYLDLCLLIFGKIIMSKQKSLPVNDKNLLAILDNIKQMGEEKLINSIVQVSLLIFYIMTFERISNNQNIQKSCAYLLGVLGKYCDNQQVNALVCICTSKWLRINKSKDILSDQSNQLDPIKNYIANNKSELKLMTGLDFTDSAERSDSLIISIASCYRLLEVSYRWSLSTIQIYFKKICDQYAKNYEMIEVILLKLSLFLFKFKFSETQLNIIFTYLLYQYPNSLFYQIENNTKTIEECLAKMRLIWLSKQFFLPFITDVNQQSDPKYQSLIKIDSMIDKTDFPFSILKNLVDFTTNQMRETDESLTLILSHISYYQSSTIQEREIILSLYAKQFEQNRSCTSDQLLRQIRSSILLLSLNKSYNLYHHGDFEDIQSFYKMEDFIDILCDLMRLGWDEKDLTNLLKDISVDQIRPVLRMMSNFNCFREDTKSIALQEYLKKPLSLPELHKWFVKHYFDEPIDYSVDELLKEFLTNKFSFLSKNEELVNKIKVIFNQINISEIHSAKIKPNGYDKQISLWEKEEFRNYPWQTKVNRLADLSVAEWVELLAIINQAWVLNTRDAKELKSSNTVSVINTNDVNKQRQVINVSHTGNKLRPNQLLAILILLLNKDQHYVGQLATGQGKSVLLAIVALINALQGKSVDIVVTSPIFSQEHAHEFKFFYKLFGLTVSHNYEENESGLNTKGQKPFYKANIVYGTQEQFAFDILRHEFQGLETRGDRKFDIVLVDEFDNIAGDRSDEICRLSEVIPAFDYLLPIYQLIWFHLKRIISLSNELILIKKSKQVVSFDEIVDQDYRAVVEEIVLAKPKTNVVASLTKFLDKKVREVIELTSIDGEFKPTEEKLIDKERKVIPTKILIPQHLISFAEIQIPAWINSAIHALFFVDHERDYVIGQDQQERRRVEPVDFLHTGVTKKNTQWANGLHQFVQLHEKLPMTAEGLTTNFLSTRAYFNRYQQLIGVTGTIGDEYDHELYRALYEKNKKLLIVDIPRHAKRKFLYHKPRLVNDTSEWLALIAQRTFEEISFRRSVLIICTSIKQVKILSNHISKICIGAKISEYKNSDQSHTFSKVIVDCGEIIISTNLAGRGLHLELTNELMQTGCLHVMVVSQWLNSRVLEQALGRAARANQPFGSGEVIIDRSQCDLGLRDNFTIEEFENAISERRLNFVDDYIKKQLPQHKRADKLFVKFCELLAKLLEINSAYMKEHYSHIMDFAADKLLEINQQTVRKSIIEQWGYWFKKHEYSLEAEDIFFEFENDMIKICKKGEVFGNPCYRLQEANHLLSYLHSWKHRFSTIPVHKERIYQYIEANCDQIMDPLFFGQANALSAVVKLDRKTNVSKTAARECLDKALKNLIGINQPQLLLSLNVASANGETHNDLVKQLSGRVSILNTFIYRYQKMIDVIDTSRKLVDLTINNNFAERNTADAILQTIEKKELENKDRYTLVFNGLRTIFDIKLRLRGDHHQVVDQFFEMKSKSARLYLLCKNLVNSETKSWLLIIKNATVEKDQKYANCNINYRLYHFRIHDLKEKINFLANIDITPSIDLEIEYLTAERLEIIKEKATELKLEYEESNDLIILKNVPCEASTKERIHPIFELSDYLCKTRIIKRSNNNETSLVNCLSELNIAIVFETRELNSQKSDELLQKDWLINLSVAIKSEVHLERIIDEANEKINETSMVVKSLIQFRAIQLLKNLSFKEESLCHPKLHHISTVFADGFSRQDISYSIANGNVYLLELKEQLPRRIFTTMALGGIMMLELATGVAILLLTSESLFSVGVGIGMIGESIGELIELIHLGIKNDFNWKHYLGRKVFSLGVMFISAGVSAAGSSTKIAGKIGTQLGKEIAEETVESALTIGGTTLVANSDKLLTIGSKVATTAIIQSVTKATVNIANKIVTSQLSNMDFLSMQKVISEVVSARIKSFTQDKMQVRIKCIVAFYLTVFNSDDLGALPNRWKRELTNFAKLSIDFGGKLGQLKSLPYLVNVEEMISPSIDNYLDKIEKSLIEGENSANFNQLLNQIFISHEDFHTRKSLNEDIGTIIKILNIHNILTSQSYIRQRLTEDMIRILESSWPAKLLDYKESVVNLLLKMNDYLYNEANASMKLGLEQYEETCMSAIFTLLRKEIINSVGLLKNIVFQEFSSALQQIALKPENFKQSVYDERGKLKQLTRGLYNVSLLSTEFFEYLGAKWQQQHMQTLSIARMQTVVNNNVIHFSIDEQEKLLGPFEKEQLLLKLHGSFFSLIEKSNPIELGKLITTLFDIPDLLKKLPMNKIYSLQINPNQLISNNLEELIHQSSMNALKQFPLIYSLNGLIFSAFFQKIHYMQSVIILAFEMPITLYGDIFKHIIKIVFNTVLKSAGVATLLLEYCKKSDDLQSLIRLLLPDILRQSDVVKKFQEKIPVLLDGLSETVNTSFVNRRVKNVLDKDYINKLQTLFSKSGYLNQINRNFISLIFSNDKLTMHLRNILIVLFEQPNNQYLLVQLFIQSLSIEMKKGKKFGFYLKNILKENMYFFESFLEQANYAEMIESYGLNKIDIIFLLKLCFTLFIEPEELQEIYSSYVSGKTRNLILKMLDLFIKNKSLSQFLNIDENKNSLDLIIKKIITHHIKLSNPSLSNQDEVRLENIIGQMNQYAINFLSIPLDIYHGDTFKVFKKNGLLELVKHIVMQYKENVVKFDQFPLFHQFLNIITEADVINITRAYLIADWNRFLKEFISVLRKINGFKNFINEHRPEFVFMVNLLVKDVPYLELITRKLNISTGELIATLISSDNLLNALDDLLSGKNFTALYRTMTDKNFRNQMPTPSNFIYTLFGGSPKIKIESQPDLDKQIWHQTTLLAIEIASIDASILSVAYKNIIAITLIDINFNNIIFDRCNFENIIIVSSFAKQMPFGCMFKNVSFRDCTIDANSFKQFLPVLREKKNIVTFEHCILLGDLSEVDLSNLDLSGFTTASVSRFSGATISGTTFLSENRLSDPDPKWQDVKGLYHSNLIFSKSLVYEQRHRLLNTLIAQIKESALLLAKPWDSKKKQEFKKSLSLLLKKSAIVKNNDKSEMLNLNDLLIEYIESNAINVNSTKIIDVIRAQTNEAYDPLISMTEILLIHFFENRDEANINQIRFIIFSIWFSSKLEEKFFKREHLTSNIRFSIHQIILSLVLKLDDTKLFSMPISRLESLVEQMAGFIDKTKLIKLVEPWSLTQFTGKRPVYKLTVASNVLEDKLYKFIVDDVSPGLDKSSGLKRIPDGGCVIS